MTPERIRINHKGGGISKISLAMQKFFDGLFIWGETGKKFHVSIDYDPEWTILIRFRFSTKEEAEELDSLRPAKEEIELIKGNKSGM